MMKVFKKKIKTRQEDLTELEDDLDALENKYKAWQKDKDAIEDEIDDKMAALDS